MSASVIISEKAQDGEHSIEAKSAARDKDDVIKKVLQHSSDADEAMKALESADGPSVEIDDSTNRRILRKIDLNLMPLLCFVYGLNYLDKTTLSYASITGLEDELGIGTTQYSWIASTFYFGYLGFEWPTNFLLQKLPLAKYSSFNIIMWGVVLSCFAAVQNYAGAIAIRFFLGVFESAVTPGFALFTSQWYTKREQASRIGIWFSFNGFAQIFGGLVAYGIAKGSNYTQNSYTTVIPPWKIIFLFTGLLTFIVGIIFLVIMPDNPLNARFLSKADRILAIERIRRNEQGVGNKHWKRYQFIEALTDPLSWMFAFYALVADIPNGGISNFFSQLIVSFGYSPLQSLLYGTPAGAVEVISLLSWGIFTGYFPNIRITFAAFWLVIAVIGIVLIVALPLDNNSGRLAGYYLTQASPAPFVAILSLISTNIAGYTKKTTVAAMYLIAYCIGNIIGPQTFRSSDAPRFVPAEITILCCWCACLVDLALIVVYCKWQNARKARVRADPAYTKLPNQEFLDLTDAENPDFTYVY